MKSIAHTLRRIYFALEFANAETLGGLKEMLDRHESRISENAAPKTARIPEGREIGIDNVYYLNPSLPAK